MQHQALTIIMTFDYMIRRVGIPTDAADGWHWHKIKPPLTPINLKVTCQACIQGVLSYPAIIAAPHCALESS